MVTRPAEDARRGAAVLPGEERRRSQRVVIRVPVILHFTPAKPGKPFTAYTVVVNDHGAMLICERTFEAETRFELENAHTHQRTACRVTRPPRHSPEGYFIPVEFSKPAPGFWAISFPPWDWKPFND
jgi:hypothetical protein